MFRHVVLLRFVPETTDDQKAAIIDALRQLPAQIPELRDYRAGIDAGLAETNFDLAVVADVDDEAAYVVYRDHEAHQQVIRELIAPILAERAAVQYQAGPPLA